MRVGLLVCGLSVLALGGCMHSSDTSTVSGAVVSQDASGMSSGVIASGSTASFYASIPSCVSYLATVTCMNNQGNTIRQEKGDDMINKVLETRKMLNQDQLKATCDASKNVLVENKALIEKAGCSL